MVDVFAMQDEIAAAVTSALRIKLARQSTTHRHYKPSVPAYDAVLKARHFRQQINPELLTKGREYVMQAIGHDRSVRSSFASTAYEQSLKRRISSNRFLGRCPRVRSAWDMRPKTCYGG